MSDYRKPWEYRRFKIEPRTRPRHWAFLLDGRWRTGARTKAGVRAYIDSVLTLRRRDAALKGADDE